MARRINYLHYLQSLNKNELLFTFFDAQLQNPQNGDWVLTVQENLNDIGFKIELDKIKSVKQDKFKKMTKTYIYKAAFEYLLAKATGHSKMDNLKYEKYEMQSYLKNKKVSKNEAQDYFKFRTRMADFSANFGAQNIPCSLCNKRDINSQYLDSQPHFLVCQVVINEVLKLSSINHQDIYSTKKVNTSSVKTLLEALDRREQLLSEP